MAFVADAVLDVDPALESRVRGESANEKLRTSIGCCQKASGHQRSHFGGLTDDRGLASDIPHTDLRGASRSALRFASRHTTCEATMRSASAAWLIIGFLAACARPSISHTNPGPVTLRSSDASLVVTRSELDRSAPSGTLMAALQKIRPWFLTGRGGTLLVSLEGSVLTDASVLRTISVPDVCEVRLVRGTSGAGRSVVLPNGSVSSGDDLIDVSLRPCSRR